MAQRPQGLNVAGHAVFFTHSVLIMMGRRHQWIAIKLFSLFALAMTECTNFSVNARSFLRQGLLKAIDWPALPLRTPRSFATVKPIRSKLPMVQL